MQLSLITLWLEVEQVARSWLDVWLKQKVTMLFALLKLVRGLSLSVVRCHMNRVIVCYSHEGIDNSRMPGGLPALYQEGAVDWNYQTVPQKGCKNRVIAASRGRLLGGCSAVNGTVFTRGAKADYNRIADMGNPGWSWNEMVPYFKASETFHPAEWHQADLSAHGVDGPLHTEPHPLMPISQKVLDSFLDQGFEYKPDMFVQGEFEGRLSSQKLVRR